MTALPDPSDEATGLPPLEDIEPRMAILAVKLCAGDGAVAIPFTNPPDTTQVKYLSFRGLVPTGAMLNQVEWAQVHIAVPLGDLPALRRAIADD